MAFVELTDITAGYVKDNPVLRGFHLEVEKGELLSLLGPSGCGKTTTLRTIAGFILAQKGTITVGGREVTNVPPNKRNIGLVFQNYALFPHLSVFENVAYGLKRRHVERGEIQRRVAEVLEMVSLTGFEKRLPAQLSGGQRQRVALARSIVIEPDLLLLDEPLSNLDAKLREEMRAELSRLQHQLNITMIYVTHDQIEALSLSSKIVVMNEGEIEQIGTPEEIYESPATPFVARFMGFDNRITGTVTGVEAGAVVVQVGESTFRCTRTGGAMLTGGDEVLLFFRPGDAEFTAGAAENTLPVTVNYTNYHGSSTLYAARSGDETVAVVMAGKPADLSTYTAIHIPSGAIIVERKPNHE